MSTEHPQYTSHPSPKWQERFDYFQRVETLDRADRRAVARSLGFWKSIRINFNFFAFFFGFIYFFVLGMWRRNLSMLAITLLLYAAVLFVAMVADPAISNSFSQGVGFGIPAWYAATANMAYYLKEVKGYNGWNPFKFKA